MNSFVCILLTLTILMFPQSLFTWFELYDPTSCMPFQKNYNPDEIQLFSYILKRTGEKVRQIGWHCIKFITQVGNAALILPKKHVILPHFWTCLQSQSQFHTFSFAFSPPTSPPLTLWQLTLLHWKQKRSSQKETSYLSSNIYTHLLILPVNSDKLLMSFFEANLSNE